MITSKYKSARWYLIMIVSIPIVLFGSLEFGEVMLKYSSLDSGSRGVISACIGAVTMPGLFWVLQFVPGSPGLLTNLQKIVFACVPVLVFIWAIYLVFLYQ